MSKTCMREVQRIFQEANRRLLLLENADQFPKSSDDLGHTVMVRHKIDTGDQSGGNMAYSLSELCSFLGFILLLQTICERTCRYC